MLSARAWKLEAVIRLAGSVFLCYSAGIIISATLPVISEGRATIKLLTLDGLGLGCLATAMVLVRRSWAEGKPARRLAMVLFCAYTGMLLGFWGLHVAGHNKSTVSTGQMLVALVSFQGALLAFLPGFLREHEAEPIEVFGLNNRLALSLAGGVFIACMFYMAGGLIQAATAWLMQHFPAFPIKPVEQAAVHTLRFADSWIERVALGTGAIILAPLAEEVLFRGILYPWIKSLGYPQLALWGTSLLFAIVHFNLLSLPALFVLALLLTLLYEFTGNLLAPITAHIFFNALNLLQLYSIDRMIQQQPY